MTINIYIIGVKIMDILFLGIILILRVIQKITGKAMSNDMPSEPRGLSEYLSIKSAMSALAALILLALTTNIADAVSGMPALGWIISIATGITLTVSSACSLLALKHTSVLLNALFGAAGLLVPTISGIFIFGEKVGVGQWCGIACLLLAALLLASSSGKTNGKITFKTLLLLFGSMLANGTTMLLQTLYRRFVPGGDVSLYSFLQFVIPAIALLLASFMIGLFKRNQAPRVKYSNKLMLCTALSAIALFGISQISTIASKTIPVAVLFPISDGGGMIISGIVAWLIYRERLTVKSTLGIIMGVLGLCLIKLLTI